MIRVLLCAMVLSAAVAQVTVTDYQERQVYYSEKENVCRYGSGFDWVNLAITLDGSAFNEVTIKTPTYCSQWGNTYASQLGTSSKWSFFDGTDYLKFEDQTINYRFEDELIGIVQKTTLRSKAVLGNRPCTCVILGNGEVLHFGGSAEFAPPTINISCTTDETDKKQ